MQERSQNQPTTSRKPRNQPTKRSSFHNDSNSNDRTGVKSKKSKADFHKNESGRPKSVSSDSSKSKAAVKEENAGKLLKQNGKRKSSVDINNLEISNIKKKRIESHTDSNVSATVQKSMKSKPSTSEKSPSVQASKHDKIKSQSRQKSKPITGCDVKLKKLTTTEQISGGTSTTKTNNKNSGNVYKPTSTSKSKASKEKIGKAGNEGKKNHENPKKKEKKNHPASHKCHKPSVQSATTAAIDVTDPLKVLMMMEGIGGSKATPAPLACPPSTSASQKRNEDIVEDSANEGDTTMMDSESEGISDWEEVHDHSVAPERSQIPDKPVEITLELPDILKHKKRKKKAFDWKAYLERRVRRFKKDVAMDMHKVHLLCLLSLGMQQNDHLNDPILRGLTLSLLPAQFTAKTKSSVEVQVDNLLLWYKRKFSLENVTHCSDIRLITPSSLSIAISSGSITDARVWVLVFICLLRTVGLTVRMILSFQPIPFKGAQGSDEKKGKKGQKPKNSTKPKSSGKGGTPKSSVSAKPVTKPSSSKPLSAKSSSNKSSSKKPSSSSKKKSTTPSTAPSAKRRLSVRESSKKAVLKNRASLNESDDCEDDSDKDEDFSVGEVKNVKKQKRNNESSDSENEQVNDDPSSEAEFEENSFNFRSPNGLQKDMKILSNRKVLSPTTSEDELNIGQKSEPLGHDFWLEVYFPEKKKWRCFDCFKSRFDKPYSLENSATQPLTYVLGFNNVGWVKDVTARYAKQWLSHTRKNRIDQEWWEDTLYVFDQTPHQDKVIEEDEIKGQLLVRPMPTSIGEFKGHPLYALRRHLLKFEAIYPDTAIPMGYIKKEPIYARECVRTLHSRDNWIKEGRLVRLNESPYKMVKSRPKWNKPKENPNELDLELFGEWQTEIYIPPPAVDGKVPRNAYGNVELFKEWMLPKGTVQVRGQGIQRVAKKLGIDVAQAMIGWDHHSGYPHPVMDGFIVCEEFADTLMAAVEEDQEIQKQREIEKKEKRVYGNWRLLIRGLLIKERLTNKFLQEKPLVEEKPQKETFSDGEEAADIKQSWPQNRKEEKKEKPMMKADKFNAEKIQVLIKKELKKEKEPSGTDLDVQERKPLLMKPALGKDITLHEGGKRTGKGGKGQSQRKGGKSAAMSQISNKPVVRKIANFESSDSELDFEDVSDGEDITEDINVCEKKKFKAEPKALPHSTPSTHSRPSRSAGLRKSTSKVNYCEKGSDSEEENSGDEEVSKRKTPLTKEVKSGKKGKGILDLSEGESSEEDIEEEVKISKKKTAQTKRNSSGKKGEGGAELQKGNSAEGGNEEGVKDSEKTTPQTKEVESGKKGKGDLELSEADSTDEDSEKEVNAGKRKAPQTKGAKSGRKGKNVSEVVEENSAEEDNEETIKVRKRKTPGRKGAENVQKEKSVPESSAGDKKVRGRRRNLRD